MSKIVETGNKDLDKAAVGKIFLRWHGGLI
jgi:hypothetical protein